MKNTIKKMLIIILCMNLITISTLNIQGIYAISPEDAGVESTEPTEEGAMNETTLRENFKEAIIGFYNAHAGQCTYNYNDRNRTYAAGADSGNYGFDCVGWVSCAIHWFLGIGAETFTYFVTPQNGVVDTEHFQETSLGTEQIGDVLIMNNGAEVHVAIYIGEGNGGKQVLDMWTNGLAIRTLASDYSYSSPHWGSNKFTAVGHLNNLDGITFMPAGTMPVGPSGEIDDITVDLDEQTFEFAGTPQKITLKEVENPFIWLFSKLSEIVDYILGIMTSGMKAAFVGWTSIIEDAINNALLLLSGRTIEEDNS